MDERDVTDEPSLADAAAEVNRWIDREHHRLPSHPVATSVAVVLSALSTTQAELATAKAERDAAVAGGMYVRQREAALRAQVVELKVLLEVCADPDEYDAAHRALSNLVKEVESGT